MESAELERTTVDIVAKVGARKLELRATGQVVKFDGFLTLYQEGHDEDDEDEEMPPPAGHERRRSAGQAGDQFRAALHRAAAALFGSRAGQAHGGTRHRPPLDLRLDPAGAAGPRLCAHRQEALHAGGQGPRGDRLPRELLPALCRIRFHRQSRRAARPHLQRRARLEEGAARFLGRFHRRGQRDQGPARHPRARCAQRSAGAAHLPAARRRRRCAAVPDLRHRPAFAEARQVRRLHRLLELSGVPFHPADDAGTRKARSTAPRCSARTR